MIDEEKHQAESEKLAHMIDIALNIDVSIMEQALPDVKFLSTVVDGWVGDMMRTAAVSMEAFLEYRAKLDVIVSDMGLDMLKGTKE